jgi:hypothetical protein
MTAGDSVKLYDYKVSFAPPVDAFWTWSRWNTHSHLKHQGYRFVALVTINPTIRVLIGSGHWKREDISKYQHKVHYFIILGAAMTSPLWIAINGWNRGLGHLAQCDILSGITESAGQVRCQTQINWILLFSTYGIAVLDRFLSVPTGA